MEEYHRISDKTMDILLAYLEEIVYSESSGENGWEVDYNVGSPCHNRPTTALIARNLLDMPPFFVFLDYVIC